MLFILCAIMQEEHYGLRALDSYLGRLWQTWGNERPEESFENEKSLEKLHQSPYTAISLPAA